MESTQKTVESTQSAADPASFLASLERRHEEILVRIDELADRIEKTLLEFKPQSQTPAVAATAPRS